MMDVVYAYRNQRGRWVYWEGTWHGTLLGTLVPDVTKDLAKAKAFRNETPEGIEGTLAFLAERLPVRAPAGWCPLKAPADPKETDKKEGQTE